MLDKQKVLEAQSFWDNRDWDWYAANIPFFESPDPEIDKTYYYRWELVTKHLTYGSPQSGYSFTEFIDRPFWSGAYGSISCPAGHQLYEVRWFRDPRYARDYARYWFRTLGAEPRRYSCWLADAVWAVQQAHPDSEFAIELLPGLIGNYEGWERRHFVPEVGLFWQTGHDDGMEFNINSRQTQDIVRGAPGFRPTLNSYMWADAKAIARIARLRGDEQTAHQFEKKTASLKQIMQRKLWDPRREFFFPMAQRDEERDGYVVKALSLTHQTGRFAGSPHGRELIGYVPWQFNMPDAGYETAWKFLMDPAYFLTSFGPTTVERRDPMFHLSPTCCWWSGQSWPYATTQTLLAGANLLNNYEQMFFTREDYFRLLRTYALTHRKQGRPYIAEAAHPETGSWEGHDSYNHSEHYFHSGFTDLVITGLVGLRPRSDNLIEVNPLAPAAWDYFALDNVLYQGHEVAVVWDRSGTHYNLGSGLHLVVDGKAVASSTTLDRLIAPLPDAPVKTVQTRPGVNYAVNNDGYYFPRATSSLIDGDATLYQVHDGNYWYHLHPPNRWTMAGTGVQSDWCAMDFGTARRLHTVKLFLLDDGPTSMVVPPASVEVEYWTSGAWAHVPGQTRIPEKPAGRRANVISFPTIATSKLRVVFTHQPGKASGLSELEIWGDGPPPATEVAPPGNLAFNPTGIGYPKASASWTSRFDKIEMVNDGKIIFRPTPHNRWTAFESPHGSDWLEIDFGREQTFGRVELSIYDDRGGVQPPVRYDIQLWDGSNWKAADHQEKQPPEPAGGRVNSVTFTPVSATKMRVVLEHKGESKSGLTEIAIWRE